MGSPVLSRFPLSGLSALGYSLVHLDRRSLVHPPDNPWYTFSRLLTYQLVVPVQEGLGRENQDLAQLRPRTPGNLLELDQQDCQEALFAAAGLGPPAQLPFQYSQLLAQQQDFKVFVRRCPVHGDHIYEEADNHRDGIPDQTRLFLARSMRRSILARLPGQVQAPIPDSSPGIAFFYPTG